jgi:transposase
MQGHKQFVDKVVLHFRLSERMLTQNLYRRLADLLDWDFLYDQTQALYSHTGQPSLDPVVFKLMLVSRLENLVSDRRLIEHCSLRLGILYFLGYEVDEDLPWHSTISRNRQLFPATVFEQLFDHVFAQCVTAGLVTGYTQAMDAAFVKANALLESLCEKQAVEIPLLPVAGEPVAHTPAAQQAALLSSPTHQLQPLASTHARYLRNTSGPLGRGRPQAQLLSNKTHYSPADPEARISVKLGKARAFSHPRRAARAAVAGRAGGMGATRGLRRNHGNGRQWRNLLLYQYKHLLRAAPAGAHLPLSPPATRARRGLSGLCGVPYPDADAALVHARRAVPPPPGACQ